MQNVENPPEAAVGLKKVSRPPPGYLWREKWKVLSAFPPFHTLWKRGMWKKENYGENRNFMETKRNQQKEKFFGRFFWGKRAGSRGKTPCRVPQDAKSPMHSKAQEGQAGAVGVREGAQAHRRLGVGDQAGKIIGCRLTDHGAPLSFMPPSKRRGPGSRPLSARKPGLSKRTGTGSTRPARQAPSIKGREAVLGREPLR